MSVKSAVKANISMEACQFYLHQLLSSDVNYRKELVCNMFSKNFILSAGKFKGCFGLKQASDCYYKLVTNNLTTTFWWYSKANEQSWNIHWILLDVFFYIQLSFSIFLMDSKVNCQIHIITDVWKEYFIKECFWSEKNILRVRFDRLAVPGVQ